MKAAFLASVILAISVTAGVMPLADSTLEMDVGQYRFLKFRVQRAQAEAARIVGAIGVSPDTLEIELILITEFDLPRWRHHSGDVDTLFYQRQGSGEVDFPLSTFGDLVFIMSNRGNYDPATVDIDLDLEFEGSGTEYNSFAVALKVALIIMALTAVIILVAGLVRLSKRRSG